MNADKLLQHCQRLGIRLFVHAGELVVDTPGCAPNPWLCAQLSENKVELLGLLTSREQDATREEHQREVEQYADVLTSGRTCPHCHSRDIALIPTAKPPHWAELRCMTCERWVGWQRDAEGVGRRVGVSV